MALNKSYKYKMIQGKTADLLDQTSDLNADAALQSQMNKLGEMGWRFVSLLPSGGGLLMELEGVRTDAGTAGAFQAAGLKVKGKK
jgi:hypothetical protein